MSYARLGTVYNNLGQTALSEQNRQKAFELRDRASEREKLYIIAHYYADSGQLDKGITAYELYLQTYPRDPAPYNNLSLIYNQLGQFDNALENAKRAVELDPDMLSGYSQVAEAYIGLNRLDEARASANAVFQHKGSTRSFHVLLAVIDWDEGKEADMEHELQLASGVPDADLNVFGFRTALAGSRGQIEKARDFARQDNELLDRLQLKNKPNVEANLSTLEALAGDHANASADANNALGESKTLGVMATAGVALAAIRDPKASAIADEILREYPNDTMAVNSTVPQIRAIVALFPPNSAKPNPARAIDLLNTAALYARGNAGVFYLRGLAYEMAGRYAEAQQDFQKVVDFSHRSGPDIVYTATQVELGRVYQKQGNIPQARIAYQNFLAAWKDADPGLPLLRTAKSEYAKLQ